MAHLQQFQFIDALKKTFPHFFVKQKVCEIGSLDINGSIREKFNSCDYTGFDISEGPGVDKAVQGQLISDSTGSYDVTISCECFEHNPYWVETFVNMLRLTRPGGLVVMSCATIGRPEHGTDDSDVGSSPLTTKIGWNYYRNLTDKDLTGAINLEGWFSGYQFLMHPETSDLYFYGIRHGGDLEYNSLIEVSQQMLDVGARLITAWLKQTGEVFCGKRENGSIFMEPRPKK